MAGTLAQDLGACAATIAVARIKALLVSEETDQITKDILRSTRRVLQEFDRDTQVDEALTNLGVSSTPIVFM